MNWDEKGRAWANTIMPNVPLPDEPGELRDNGIQINLKAKSERAGFEVGARWQRRMLRTDEAIERVARALFEADQGETVEEHQEWCERPTCNTATGYHQQARAAITALLGEN